MDDAIARFQAASEANDIDGLMATMAADVELISPLSGRMVFRGQKDVRVLFAAVYGTLEGLRWTLTVSDGPHCVAVGEARVGPLRMTDAMVLELDSGGQIRRISPHLRPWLPVTLFALLLGPKVALHPGVIKRALAG